MAEIEIDFYVTFVDPAIYLVSSLQLRFMLNTISPKNFLIVLSVFILLISNQLSYADDNSFTVNVPNAQGGYTPLVLQKSGTGYFGPQGEYYPSFPDVLQLQAVYRLNTADPLPIPAVTTIEYVTVPPPALPVYVPPEAPDFNYVWAPGYWAYDSFWEDYYWVPGTWVMAPHPGLLWTPGYWYWRGGYFIFSGGYWGRHIGFYGGINYGHGYRGMGHASFNGGPGGINAQPTFAQQAAMKEKHFPATAQQRLHVQGARNNPVLRASLNHGRPAIAATSRPGVFKGRGVVAAKLAGAPYKKPAHHPPTMPKAKVRKPLSQKGPNNWDNAQY